MTLEIKASDNKTLVIYWSAQEAYKLYQPNPNQNTWHLVVKKYEEITETAGKLEEEGYKRRGVNTFELSDEELANLILKY